MDIGECEPLRFSGHYDVLLIGLHVLGIEIGVDGKILLNEFCIKAQLLLDAFVVFSLVGFEWTLLI